MERPNITLPPRDAWANSARDAAHHMQDRTQWLVGVLGTLVAGLAVGAQFSNVGQLDLNEPRLWVAAGAALAALIAIGGALVTVLGVGAGPIDLDKLTMEELRYAHESGLLVGYQSSQEFFEQREHLLTVYKNVRDPYRPNLVVPPQVSGDVLLAELEDRLTEIAWQYHDLAALVTYLRVLRRYQLARRVVLIGGAFAGASLLVLAWAANPGPME